MPNVASLIVTGAALGAVHVLTGPDHLSALATLSANIGSTSAAFWLGVRWGIGHSTGLLLVGIVCILLSRRHTEEEHIIVNEGLTHFFESCIGVFMILLGTYGIHRAYNRRRATENGQAPTDPHHSHHSHHTQHTQNFHDYHQRDTEDSDLNGSLQDGAPIPDELARLDTDNEHQDNVEDDSSIRNKQLDCVHRFFDCLRTYLSKLSAQALALLAGILHGLAGPGAVLAVIPAARLRDAQLATTYLSSFCVCSTLTMGTFAAIYGTCSSRLAAGNPSGQMVFRIECGSACLSLIVGILWLTLLALGKLDEVFP